MAILIVNGRVELPLVEGDTLLQHLLRTDLDVAHECGGKLACASCLVLVRGGGETLSAASDDENDMLERSGAARPGARLACQALAGSGDVALELGSLPASGASAPTQAVTVTERAARHLRAQLGKRPGAALVRLSVRAAGCSGLRYQLDYAERAGATDAVFESSGVRIAVTADSLPFVQGTRLDLVREGLAQRVRFDNPNVRQACGCGESFAA
jgi:iron-sulfur cluster assembly protein